MRFTDRQNDVRLFLFSDEEEKEKGNELHITIATAKVFEMTVEETFQEMTRI